MEKPGSKKDNVFPQETIQKTLLYSSGKERFKPHRQFDFPQEYGDNKITLMTKDSHTLYAYWDITKSTEDSMIEKIKNTGRSVSKKILRIYEITKVNTVHDPKLVCDFDLEGAIDNWYVDVDESGKAWMASVGIVCKTGEFMSLAQSDIEKTPVDGMSKKSNKKWPCSKNLYDKMLAVTGGCEDGQSSY